MRYYIDHEHRAYLQSFRGLVCPEFIADGGLVVQIPVKNSEVSQQQLRAEILKLSQEQGNEYLRELVERKDIDWQQIVLTQKDWDYKQQGLTPAGAAILAIAITIATSGAGSAISSSVSGSLTNTLYDAVNKAKKANRTLTKQDVKKILEDNFVDITLDFAGDLLTIFGRDVSALKRMEAALDLFLGTDLNSGKVRYRNQNMSTLKELMSKDRNHVQNRYNNKVDNATRIRAKGRAFESQAAIAKGVDKNKVAYHVKTEKDGEFMVIPDAFDDKGSIVEFKNVKYLSDSRQFRGYVAMNKPIHLILNPTSEYSEKIELMIKGSYGTIQRFDPNTKKFVIIADFTKR